MSDAKEIQGPRIHRSPAVAAWEHAHRWGTGLGDTTTMRVSRVNDGAMTITYGSESVEIRGALVAQLAEMVAAAAAWTDPEATS